MGRIVDKASEFAVLMGVSRNCVNTWIHKGMPKTEDNKIDVEIASAWLKEHGAYKGTSSIPKVIKDEIVALAMNTKKTRKQIASLTGIDPRVVNTIVKMAKKYGPGLQKFKETKSDIFALEQMRYLDFITDKKLELAPARDLAGMAKIAWEKERVERGESTDNVAVIVKHIMELKESEADADQG